jgi:hypothetical protein
MLQDVIVGKDIKKMQILLSFVPKFVSFALFPLFILFFFPKYLFNGKK